MPSKYYESFVGLGLEIVTWAPVSWANILFISSVDWLKIKFELCFWMFICIAWFLRSSTFGLDKSPSWIYGVLYLTIFLTALVPDSYLSRFLSGFVYPFVFPAKILRPELYCASYTDFSKFLNLVVSIIFFYFSGLGVFFGGLPFISTLTASFWFYPSTEYGK